MAGPSKSTVKRHPQYQKILRMLRHGEAVSAIARQFGLTQPALFRFRRELRKKAKPRTPDFPASVKLRSQALDMYMKGNGDSGSMQRGATLERKAIDLEDMEDYCWSLDRPLAPTEDEHKEELTIRQEMARLDGLIAEAISNVTNGTKPPRLLGIMADRELLVERFREVLRDRQAWRRLQRKQWKSRLSYSTSRSSAVRVGNPRREPIGQ